MYSVISIVMTIVLLLDYNTLSTLLFYPLFVVMDTLSEKFLQIRLG